MRRSLWVLLLALVASLALTGIVMARHAPAGLVVTDILRGTLTRSLDYNQGGIEVETEGPVDVVTLEATFEKGGGSAGWHHHPGPVFVVVRTGTVSVWNESCRMRTYSAGDTFFDRGPRHSMLVKNESATEDATVNGTFIVPVGAAPLSIPDRHRCGMRD